MFFFVICSFKILFKKITPCRKHNSTVPNRSTSACCGFSVQRSFASSCVKQSLTSDSKMSPAVWAAGDHKWVSMPALASLSNDHHPFLCALGTCSRSYTQLWYLIHSPPTGTWAGTAAPAACTLSSHLAVAVAVQMCCQERKLWGCVT